MSIRCRADRLCKFIFSLVNDLSRFLSLIFFLTLFMEWVVFSLSFTQMIFKLLCEKGVGDIYIIPTSCHNMYFLLKMRSTTCIFKFVCCCVFLSRWIMHNAQRSRPFSMCSLYDDLGIIDSPHFVCNYIIIIFTCVENRHNRQMTWWCDSTLKLFPSPYLLYQYAKKYIKISHTCHTYV